MHNAQLYVASNQMQAHDIKQLLENTDYLIKWPNEGIVLDIGCGPGDVTSSLLRSFVSENVAIIGADISQDMIDYANATYANANTFFKCLDVESNHIWNEWQFNSCDVIASFYCIHWVQDQQRAAENIYGLLKEGGDFLALFLGKSPFYKLYEYLSYDDRWTFLIKGVKRIDSPFQSSEDPVQFYRDVLTKAKFQKIQVEQKFTSFSFPTKRSILDSIIAVDPFYKRVPEDLRAEYRETIMDIVMDRELAYETDEGRMETKYSIMLAKGSKK